MNFNVSNLYQRSPKPYTHLSHDQAGTVATIRDFRRLQELELIATRLVSPHEALLSSITSTDLRKVVFLARYIYTWTNFAKQTEAWGSIDEQLCMLVDRLRATGYNHTLEVEVRLTEMGHDHRVYDFTILLPKFRQKGIVTITRTFHGTRLLHSSTHTS